MINKLFIILATSVFVGCVADQCQEMGEREAIKILSSKGLPLCAREKIYWMDGEDHSRCDTILTTCSDGNFPNAILDSSSELGRTIVF